MRFRKAGITVLLVAMSVAIGISSIDASTVAPRNLAEIVGSADDIVVGTVTVVEEGRQGNLPYVEVEFQVRETIKGVDRQTLTFRQIGVLAPQPAENGRIFAGITAGMPRYEVGEKLVLFLGPESASGLRTTVGLHQGKFSIRGGSVSNGFGNAGLFVDMPETPGDRTQAETAMLATREGSIAAGTFVNFVRQAVDSGWWHGPSQGIESRGADDIPEQPTGASDFGVQR